MYLQAVIVEGSGVARGHGKHGHFCSFSWPKWRREMDSDYPGTQRTWYATAPADQPNDWPLRETAPSFCSAPRGLLALSSRYVTAQPFNSI